MKVPAWSTSRVILVFASLTCSFVPVAFGQKDSSPSIPRYFSRSPTVAPLKSAEIEKIMQDSLSGATIPLWTYKIVSLVDNKTYSGVIVGRSPFAHGHRTTTIQAFLIPVKLTFKDTGITFDPSTDACTSGDTILNLTQNSPLFQNAVFDINGIDVGFTQYIDKFQRANFWANVGGTSYHTLLSITTLASQPVTVAVGNGTSTNINGPCNSHGQINFGWLDSEVQTLISSLLEQGVTPTTFPIILLENTVLCDPSCQIGGYHSSFSNPMQTYTVSDFETSGSNVSILSHEIGEWMDDPTGGNQTPNWGHTGQVTGCQSNLEVADPLTGTLFPAVTMPNGFTYNMQELAFFSWFFSQSPSIAANGKYSDNGTFAGYAKPCPPGGTN